jgi:hypothetical protein
LLERRDDRRQLAAKLRETYNLCDGHDDLAGASPPQTCIFDRYRDEFVPDLSHLRSLP